MTIQEMAKFVLEIEENAEQADVEGFALPGSTLGASSPVMGQTQVSSLAFQTYVPKYNVIKTICKSCHG